MSLRVKKGDKVVVLSGRSRGKTGKILKVIPDKGRVVIEGMNLVKKHMRRRSENEPGGIKEIPASIHISNLALFCSNCNRAVRFGVSVATDKSKIRICRRCQRPL